ncbi:MAG TPA: DUF2066 domain-containing protein [Rhizomicrobium sp.]|nr:DUF2066 domain-containing protein [Rhizomicrobium sp.]
MSRLVRLFALACVFALSAAVPAAADDPYTVRNIHVDASAVSASEALNLAISQGRPRAWQTVFRRLTRQTDWAKQPQLDDLNIQRLIRSYTVANERKSTTRYTADVTYIFNQDQVRRLLKNTGVGYTDTVAKRILIIPMAPGYNRMSAWNVAWNNPKLLNGTVPLVMPVGDAQDQVALSKLNFEKATWKSVLTLAQRAQSNEVALLLLEGGKVRIHHLSSTPISGEAITDIPVAGGLGAATASVQNALEDYWKMRAAVDFSKRLRQTVTARFDSLSDWLSLLGAFNTVPTVVSVDVVAMNTGEARIGVTYAGGLDAVQDALGRAKVTLSQDSGVWSVRTGAPMPTSPATSPQ